MTGKGDTRKAEGRGRPERRAGGFARAGALIAPQMNRVSARRGYLEARLAALWPEIAGPEIAAIAWPVRLTLARGPQGGALSLAVMGAHAPQAQMMLPLILERVNTALGAGLVRRITLTQAPRLRPPPPPRSTAAAPVERPPAPLAPVPGEISSIGDEDLRRALETLARNVLSRSAIPS